MSETINSNPGEKINTEEWDNLGATEEQTPEAVEETKEDTVEEPQDDLRAAISADNEKKAEPEPKRFVLPDGRVIFGTDEDYRDALVNMREAQ